MSREYVSTEFDCWRISVIIHRSASDKLAVVHSSCMFGAESCSGQRERVSDKVSNQRFACSRRLDSRARNHMIFLVQFGINKHL